MPAKIKGRLPTIPEYYSDFINASVDLRTEPKQCCPFHKEDTPSFSYSADKGVWRCFGSCKCGGDVIKLHQKNYKLSSAEEARESLNNLYEVPVKKELQNEISLVDGDRVEMEILYQRILMRANTVERWLDLDYVMSKYPVEEASLQDLLAKWDAE